MLNNFAAIGFQRDWGICVVRERRASHGVSRSVDRPCSRVVDRVERYTVRRKITLPHGVRRHSGQKRLPGADARPLVVEEEKRPVLAVVDLRNQDRRADAEPELVLLERGDRRAVGIVEEIVGVQIAVAQKFIRRSVQMRWCRT